MRSLFLITAFFSCGAFAASDCSEILGTFQNAKENFEVRIERVKPQQLKLVKGPIGSANRNEAILQTDGILRPTGSRDHYFATAEQSFCQENQLTDVHLSYMYSEKTDAMGFLTNTYTYELDVNSGKLLYKRILRTSDGVLWPQSDMILDRISR